MAEAYWNYGINILQLSKIYTEREGKIEAQEAQDHDVNVLHKAKQSSQRLLTYQGI